MSKINRQGTVAREIRRNTTWKFKKGRGDKYRRLRVLNVQSDSDKTGPYVEVRSFYLDQASWPGENDIRLNPRRMPKTILILKSTLLKDYECLNSSMWEGLSGAVLDEISSREFMPT